MKIRNKDDSIKKILFLLLMKIEIMPMWKLKCLGMFAVPLIPLGEEGGRWGFKKIHKRPFTNHKLIYICQPITKSYYEL